MTKELTPLLEAWETIKDIGLTHMTYDSDENLDSEWEYDAVEVDDGTVEDNFSDECKVIEQALLKYEKLCKVINKLYENTFGISNRWIFDDKTASHLIYKLKEFINSPYEENKGE